MSGTTSILGLGLDVSGIATGAAKAKVSLGDLKKAATDAAGAVDAVAKAGSANGGPAAQGAQAATRSLTDLKRAATDTGNEMFRVRDASNLLGSAFDRLRAIALAMGVAWGGMKLGTFVDDAARSAARFETLGVVMNRVAQQSAMSAYGVNEVALGVEKMGITMAQSRQSVVQMVQAQMDLSQGSKLARLAQDAAVIGNMNSSQAMNMLIYGIQSGHTEVLRTIGLNVNFEQSYQTLANSMHKPVEALTELEKSQARTNAALQAGAQISGAYEAAMDTAGKQLLSMQRYIDDATVKIGGAFLPAFTSLVKQAGDGLKSVNSALDSTAGQAWIGTIGRGLKGVADEAGALILSITVGLGTMAAAAALRFAIGLKSVVEAATAARAAIAAVSSNPWALAFTAIAAALTYMLTRTSDAARAHEVIARNIHDVEAATNGVRRATDELTQAEKAQAAFRAEEQVRIARARVDENAVAQRKTLAEMTKIGQGDAHMLAVGQQTPGWRIPLETLRGAPAADDLMRTKQLAQATADFAASTAPAEQRAGAFLDRFNQLNATAGDSFSKFHDAADGLRPLIKDFLDGRVAAEALTRALEAQQAALGKTGHLPFNLSEANAAVNNQLKALGLTMTGDSILSESTLKNRTVMPALEGKLTELQNARTIIEGQVADMQSVGAGDGSAAMRDSMSQIDAISKSITALMRAWPSLLEDAATVARTGLDNALEDSQNRLALAGISNPRERAGLQAGMEHDKLMRDHANQDRLAEMLGYRDAAGNPDRSKLTAGDYGRAHDQAVTLARRGAEVEFSTQQGEATAQASVQEHYAQAIAAARGDGAEAERRVTAEMERQLALANVNGNLAATEAKSREAEARAMGELIANAKQMTREAGDTTALAFSTLAGPVAVAQAKRNQERVRLARDYPANPAAQAAGLDAFGAKEAATAVTEGAQRATAMRDQLRQAQAEFGAMGLPDVARQKAVADAEIAYQRQEAMASAATDQQRASITATYNSLQTYSDKLMAVKQQVADFTAAQQAMNEVAGAVTSAFEGAAINGQKFQAVMMNLGHTIEQIALKMLITKPLENLMGGAMNWAMGGLMGGSQPAAQPAAGGTSSIGSGIASMGLFGLAGKGLSWLGGLMGFANGGTFPSASYAGLPGVSDYSGSIVSQPTLFRFANGGALGQMGEAGSEGILPLQRDSRGRLGVSAVGAATGGAGQLIVQAPITIQGGAGGSGGAPMDPRTSRDLQKHIEGLVQTAVRSTVANERRPGGDLY